jgi:hypothetical protein
MRTWWRHELDQLQGLSVAVRDAAAHCRGLRASASAAMVIVRGHRARPQHFLYLIALPHQHGLLRGGGHRMVLLCAACSAR